MYHSDLHLALSDNGETFAAAEEPQCSINKGCPGDSFIKVFGKTGKLLWTYPSKNATRKLQVMSNPAISRNGDYVAAQTITELCLNKYWDSVSERRKDIAKDIRISSTTLCPANIVLFDKAGKVLWSKPGRGFIKISPDSKCVMVIPVVFGGREFFYSDPFKSPTKISKNYPLGYSWKLFDMNGNLVMEKPVKSLYDLHSVLLLAQTEKTRGPFSDDGRYFIFGNALWDSSGSKPQKVEIKGLPENSIFTNISPNGRYAVAYSSTAADYTSYSWDSLVSDYDEDDTTLEDPDKIAYMTWPIYFIDLQKQKVLYTKTLPKAKNFGLLLSTKGRAMNNLRLIYRVAPILTNKYFVAKDSNTDFQLVDVTTGKEFLYASADQNITSDANDIGDNRLLINTTLQNLPNAGTSCSIQSKNVYFQRGKYVIGEGKNNMGMILEQLP